MRLRFADCELDTDLRELRRAGAVRTLQPKVYEVLEYLLLHRERVVTKDELLQRLWAGVIVSDSSVQRAVSLARAAIGDDGVCIRTVPRRGYHFTAAVDAAAAPPAELETRFRPRFVRSDAVHVAYHLLGEGEVDIVLLPGWVFPMRAFFDHPQVEAWLQRLTAISRVILLDKRGTGLSDRVKSLPTLEQRVDDLRAVLDAAGSRSAVLLGMSEGGPLALLYAASFPERVRGLLLAGAFARWAAAPDYAQGWAPERFEQLRRYIAHGWGSGDTIRAIVGSRAADPDIAAWAARAEQDGASPGAALDLLEMNLRVDVRALLPAVAVPTAIVHGARDPVIDVQNARYLAAHIPGARLVELDAGDHVFFFERPERLEESLRWLLCQSAPAAGHFLATVLALEPDAPLEAASLREIVSRHRGVSTDDPRIWSFDGPQRAIRCAHAILAAPQAQHRAVRVGVHAGEVLRERGALRGETVQVAAVIARSAAPHEVRVSRVVRDLVHGSALGFAPGPELPLDAGRTVPVLLSLPPVEISER